MVILSLVTGYSWEHQFIGKQPCNTTLAQAFWVAIIKRVKALLGFKMPRHLSGRIFSSSLGNCVAQHPIFDCGPWGLIICSQLSNCSFKNVFYRNHFYRFIFWLSLTTSIVVFFNILTFSKVVHLVSTKNLANLDCKRLNILTFIFTRARADFLLAVQWAMPIKR